MKTIGPIIRVAVPSPLRRLFDYLPPTQYSANLLPGMRVQVPFGRKQLIGMIVEVAPTSDLPIAQLKHINKILDHTPLLPTSLFQLLSWAADYYQYPIGDVLLNTLPILLRQGKAAKIAEEIIWGLTTKGEQIESNQLKRAPKQWQVLQRLRHLKKQQAKPHGFSAHELQLLDIKAQTLQLLKNKNLVVDKRIKKNHWLVTKPRLGPSLNKEQQQAVTKVIAARDHFSVFLLQGVTGSGKTEVYLEVLRQLLDTDQQVLVLVPEIGLTPQMVQRFRERLGLSIGLLHSSLTDQQRLQTWLAAKNGDVQIIIGTRSAIFTPFANLQGIIIDESHDISFKQWEGFKYHARDLAIRRAQLENIPIVMGSATPSLQSLHNVAQGRFQFLSLPHRAVAAQPNQFKLIDMRQQPVQEGFAHTVLQTMHQHLTEGNQILIFLNRRGYAPIVMCQQCGWIAECERCHAPLTLHQQAQQLQCHHCGKTQSIPRQCPQCQHAPLLNLGIGTERVEQFLQQRFKDKQISRIDRDATRKKGSLEDKLNAIHSGAAQILIGTQMLAKGHHFPNVTLVVILNVDVGLYSADYAASERMAQLLLQVAGRAGRAEKAGEVLLQTYHPEHPLLQLLIQQGYSAFAKQALQERQQTQLPPYCYFALVRAEAIDNNIVETFLEEVKVLLQSYQSEVQLLGPLSAPIEKRNGRFRWQLLLSATKRSALHSLLKQTLPIIETTKTSRKVRWSIDIDPVDIL